MLIFFFSASYVVADCSENFSSCTPQELCEAATVEKEGQKKWNKSSLVANHVKFAKEIKLECGVKETDETCNDNPKFCSVRELCYKANATIKRDGMEALSNHAYVSLVKEYKLNCDLVNFITLRNQAIDAKDTALVNQIDAALEQLEELSAKRKDRIEKYNVEIIKLVQGELNRLHCNAGNPDGIEDDRLKKALRLYFDRTNQDFDLSQVVYRALLNELRDVKEAVCSKKEKIAEREDPTSLVTNTSSEKGKRKIIFD